ncbi:hypothetical protein K040078D81_38280 [Blautia hominis]|uniref:Alpha-L-fucosidase n=1 Tax=Blautia hominis TaxID=2025493 RepID=A0ABQ0BE15_9FIRM
MLKGIYFMGWQRDMWNYHPSLPMKNMQMIQDIEDIHGDMLIWSCLGSGAIGLPYLDREANDDTPPRMRLYGFMNDKEFCEECRKRGITVFSVLWKSQLWEFGAEFNEDETKLLSLNILRNASKNHKYVGMSELSTNRYPHLFKPMETYFPDGLKDYKGNTVKDFLKEFKAVSLEGRSILSAWLMAPEHDHKCYSPCCCKESYLSYLKKNVEMMIDAGTGGLHIDEYDTQKHVLNNAGCFCDECMDKFNVYIKKMQIRLPDDAGDIESFHYRKYLLKKGYTDEKLLPFNGNKRWEIPLFRDFVEMQIEYISVVVKEISQHAKQYAKEVRNEEFPVTANLFQCFPISWKSKKYLDLLAGEKTDIKLRQDAWYKYAFGWLNGKECCFVEDPNQYVRDMLEDIKNGIHDRLILFLLEPIAHGFHIAFPYGSWLQNQVKDAFWPDLRVLKKLGAWLDNNSSLFPKNPAADIAVIYDLPSAYENLWTEPSLNATATYNQVEEISLEGVEELGRQGAFSCDGDFDDFFRLIQHMSDKDIVYNVIYESPDEPLTVEKISGYKQVIIPDAFNMQESTVEILKSCQKTGVEVFTFGRIPQGLKPDKMYQTQEEDALIDMLHMQNMVIEVQSDGKYGVAVHQKDNGKVLHIVNYNYNEETHKIDTLPEVRVKLNYPCDELRIAEFPENNRAEAEIKDGEIVVRNAGIYTVIECIECYCTQATVPGGVFMPKA